MGFEIRYLHRFLRPGVRERGVIRMQIIRLGCDQRNPASDAESGPVRIDRASSWGIGQGGVNSHHLLRVDLYFF